MGQQTAYCCICGGPFNVGSPNDGWTFAACLLTAARRDGKSQHDKEEEADIYEPDAEGGSIQLLRIPAEHVDGLDFNDKAPSGFRRLRALWPDPELSPGGTIFRGPLYLPVHQACMQLADSFIEQTRKLPSTATAVSIVDQASLWKVLSSRFQRTYVRNGQCTHTSNLPEPHDYYGARKCRNIDWEHDDDPEAAVIFEADPLAGSNSAEKTAEVGETNSVSSGEVSNVSPGYTRFPRLTRLWHGYWQLDIQSTTVSELE